jgi:hypothetical protein
VKNLSTLVLALIAILSGVIVLVGYFVPIPAFVTVRTIFTGWAMVLATVAIMLGVFSLLSVHLRKLRTKEAFYSFLLIVSLVATFALVLLRGSTDPISVLVYNSVQVPVEASLMALLAVTLLYATIRLLRWRADLMGIIFILTALVIVLGTAPLPILGSVPIISEYVRPVIAQVFAAAGARGILMGVALGTLMTGLRILFGADRPYGSK